MKTELLYDQYREMAWNCYQNGQLDQAEKIASLLLKINYSPAENYHILGLISNKNYDYHRAIEYFEKSHEIDENNINVLNHLGISYNSIGDYKSAVNHFSSSLSIKSDQWNVCFYLGVALKGLKLYSQAKKSYLNAIHLKPDSPELFLHLGLMNHRLDELIEAENNYNIAIKLNPCLVEAYHRKSNLLINQNRLDEAFAVIEIGLSYDESNSKLLNSLGVVYRELGKWDKSVAAFSKAVKYNPELYGAKFGRGSMLLLTGKFKEGWKDYDARILDNKDLFPTFEQPMWRGEDLTNKTIFIHKEQGFGDTIQFIRYVDLVKRLGCRIVVRCQKELQELISSLDSIDHLITKDDALPNFDYYTPILNLPKIFNTQEENIPASVPYFSINKGHRPHLPEIGTGGKLNVGFAWAGNPKHENDKNRSCRLDDFTPLFALPEIKWYSLQKGKDIPNNNKNIDFALPARLHDFYDTAIIISQLDLVITIDSAVAHLAGAMGKPVWILLPKVPDWRWMLERNDSPWYPTAKLFRQPKRGDWNSVFNAVKNELIDL